MCHYHRWQKKTLKSSKTFSLGSSVKKSMIVLIVSQLLELQWWPGKGNKTTFFDEVLGWCPLGSHSLHWEEILLIIESNLNYTLSFNPNYCILMSCYIHFRQPGKCSMIKIASKICLCFEFLCALFPNI